MHSKLIILSKNKPYELYIEEIMNSFNFDSNLIFKKIYSWKEASDIYAKYLSKKPFDQFLDSEEKVKNFYKTHKYNSLNVFMDEYFGYSFDASEKYWGYLYNPNGKLDYYSWGDAIDRKWSPLLLKDDSTSFCNQKKNVKFLEKITTASIIDLNQNWYEGYFLTDKNIDCIKYGDINYSIKKLNNKFIIRFSNYLNHSYYLKKKEVFRLFRKYYYFDGENYCLNNKVREDNFIEIIRFFDDIYWNIFIYEEILSKVDDNCWITIADYHS